MKPFVWVRALFFTVLLIACIAMPFHYDIDFVVFHGVGKWATDATQLGKIYTERAVNNGGRFYYGPPTVTLFEPFGYLKFSISKWVWVLCQLIAFWVTWWGLYRLYPFLLKSFWVWVPVFLFTINPLHNNFQSNNIQMMLLAALLTAEILSRKRDKRLQWLAGFLCAASAIVKLFPGFICALYLLTKSRVVKQGIIFGGLLFLTLPFLRYGIGPGVQLYADFYHGLFAYHGDNDLVNKQDLLCLASLLARLLNGMAPEVFKYTYVTVSTLIAAIFFVFAWETRGSATAEEERDVLALGLAIMALINPSSLVHYQAFYIPAFCSLWQFALSQKKRVAWGSMVLGTFLLVSMTVEGVVGKRWNDRLEHMSVQTYGLILLVVGLFAALLTRRKRWEGQIFSFSASIRR